MDFDRINQLNEQKLQEAEKAQLLQTIQDAGDKVATAVVQTERNNKKVTLTNDLAKPSDIAKVVEAVKAIDLKPQDLQPIADALTEVSQAIAKLPTEYPDFPSFPEAPEQREDVKVTNLIELKDYFQDVVKAVGALKTSIKFDPKIEVKPTSVNIPPVDFTPLIDALKPAEQTKEIELEDYKAQDIAGDDVFQYVGFVRPDGGWYIVENDMDGGSLRYKFGSRGYATAWKKYTNQSYKLLNEAIREI